MNLFGSPNSLIFSSSEPQIISLQIKTIIKHPLNNATALSQTK